LPRWKRRSRVDLAQIQDTRAQEPVEVIGVPLKDYKQKPGQYDPGAERYAFVENALEAARKQLRILGSARRHIGLSGKAPHQSGHTTTIFSTIAGTACRARSARPVRKSRRQRSGLRDRSTLSHGLDHGFVRENDLHRRSRWDRRALKVLRAPGRTLTAHIDYVAAAIDPAHAPPGPRHHRQQGRHSSRDVRNVTLYSPGDHPAVGRA